MHVTLRLLLAVFLIDLAVGSGICSAAEPGGSREEKVRNDKKKVEAEGFWIYNDFPAALSEAQKTGKPIVAVLRCLPCVECVKLDDDLIDADARVKPLLEKFVRVRIVSTNGLDLSLFQFDTDQSFCVFFLNADGTIYGRFGTRSHRTEWLGDVSVDGLAKALAGALALHQDYPKNKSALAAKRGPAPTFASPEQFPSLKEKYKSTINYQGNVVQSCIHCHQIGDAIREITVRNPEGIPENVLYPYPHPKILGLILDPNEMATVKSVTPGSIAAKAGIRAGDQIRSLAGQPLLSMADMQWVLHHTSPAGGDLAMDIDRGGMSAHASLHLEKGWRQLDDISWRASTWGLRRVALGGMFLGKLPEEEREKNKLAADSNALYVNHVGQYPPHNIAQQAGMRKGDVVLGVDGREDFKREGDIITYSLWDKKRGEQIAFTILRDGKRQTVNMKLPQ